MRRRPVHLAALILTVAGFAVFFRQVYGAGPRHEGLLAFLIFSIVWLAADARKADSQSVDRRVNRQLAFGLLPLMVVQAAALPFLAYRTITKPESGSKAFGRFIESHPQYQDAILIGEPDYMVEALPYYVPNRVYMARQNNFEHHVYFDRGAKRRQHLTLTELMQTVDSVSCTYRSPVLLALGYTDMAVKRSGVRSLGYRPATFSWTDAERQELRKRAKPVASFDRAVTDEYYHVVEVNPLADGRCR
jgi:hypothetical protein